MNRNLISNWLTTTFALLLTGTCSVAQQLHGDYLMDDADIAYYGTEFRGGAGFSVTSAGDFNGDGYDDMVIGTPFIYYGNPGKTYLIYGGPDDDATPRTLAPTDADIKFQGRPGDNAGFATSSAGDLNNDGLDDLLIATWSGRFGITAGPAEVHLICGSPSYLWSSRIAATHGVVQPCRRRRQLRA